MKTSTLLVILLTAAMLFLWGCARPQPAQQQPSGAATGPAAAKRGAKVELTLFTWTREDELAVNQELLRAFEQSHPDISVRILNVPGSSEA
ncbi:MAG: hypothetical protein N2512_01630, partial [Armatimonadetes bacterium]|nr:hypothetical protein [Armatimonadota bacterium]